MQDRPLGPQLDFLRVVWATSHALETTSLRMRRQAGISGPQRVIIRLLGLHPGASPTTLAQLLHQDPSTLSVQIKRMETRGLIKRKPDPHDRRRQLLVLTPAGRKFDKPMPGTVEAAVEALLAARNSADIETTKDVLLAFAKHLSTSPP